MGDQIASIKDFNLSEFSIYIPPRAKERLFCNCFCVTKKINKGKAIKKKREKERKNNRYKMTLIDKGENVCVRGLLKKEAGNSERGGSSQTSQIINKWVGAVPSRKRERNEDNEMPQKIFAFKKFKFESRFSIRVFFFQVLNSPSHLSLPQVFVHVPTRGSHTILQKHWFFFLPSFIHTRTSTQ